MWCRMKGAGAAGSVQGHIERIRFLIAVQRWAHWNGARQCHRRRIDSREVEPGHSRSTSQVGQRRRGKRQYRRDCRAKLAPADSSSVDDECFGDGLRDTDVIDETT